jgi:hypothetical protein
MFSENGSWSEDGVGTPVNKHLVRIIPFQIIHRAGHTMDWAETYIGELLSEGWQVLGCGGYGGGAMNWAQGGQPEAGNWGHAFVVLGKVVTLYAQATPDSRPERSRDMPRSGWADFAPATPAAGPAHKGDGAEPPTHS